MWAVLDALKRSGLQAVFETPRAGQVEPETRIPNPEFLISDPETRNPNPESRNPNPKTRNLNPASHNPKPENRNPKTETRNLKSLFKAQRLCVSLNSSLESNKEEEDQKFETNGQVEWGALHSAAVLSMAVDALASNINTHTHIHKYTHIHTHMHTYTHTHTHTMSRSSGEGCTRPRWSPWRSMRSPPISNARTAGTATRRQVTRGTLTAYCNFIFVQFCSSPSILFRFYF